MNSIESLTRLTKLVAGILLLTAPLLARPAETIKIAVLVPLSGPNGIVGKGQINGFNAAANHINTQGVFPDGKTIEIVPMDNKGNPQESLLLLKRAIDEDIRYVASTISSVVHALNDAVPKHNARNPDRTVLLLNFNALDPALTEAKCNFWHFRFEPHSDTQLNALTNYMAAQRAIQKVYLLNQDYAFGQSVRRGSKEQLQARRPDIQIVGDDLIPLAKVMDFAPYVAKIRASGADSVLTGNWGTDLTLLLKASHESDLPVNFYTLQAANFGTASAIAAAGADRMKAVYSWHLNAADPTWEKTLLKYQALYKTNADLAYLPAFRTLQMLAAAIAKAHSTDPAKVAHALEGMRLAGPTGEAWMRAEDHQLIAPIYVMSFAKAGTSEVKHDAEGTGFGWKTEMLIDGKANVPAMKCQMERPAR
jgi:branched-chain amino acid transport system substrate-binding protein